MTIFSLMTLIVAFIATIYIFYRIKREPGLTATRGNRYLVISNILLLLGVVLALYGQSERNNWFIFGFDLVLNLTIYCCLCWSGITTKPELTKKRLIVRPIVAWVIVWSAFFELLTYCLAGSAFDRLSLAEPSEVVHNFTLWLGSVVAVGIDTVALFVFLLEILQAYHSVTETLDATGYYQKYRYTAFTLVALGDFVFFLLVCLGLLCYEVVDNGYYYYQITLNIRNWVLLLLLVVMLPQWFWDKQTFNFFEQRHRRQLQVYVEQLRPFYQSLIEFFPSPFTSDAYEFQEVNSTVWIINSVVKTITDIRMRLWRAYAQQKSLQAGIPIELLNNPSKVSLNKDVELFQQFMGDRTRANKATALLNQIGRVAVNVPEVAVANPQSVEQLAQYYSKLAGKVLPPVKRSVKNV